MRILTIVVFCVVISNVEGFLGIGRFFGSSRRAVKRLINLVEVESRAYRTILERDVIPEFRETLKTVRSSAEEIVKLADRLENRIEETLKKVDELIERTGYRMDNLADLVIILCVSFLFVALSSLCDNRQFLFLYYSFQFIRGMCVMTAMMLTVRLICELVLRVHMSTASTINYCIIAPVVFVLTMVILNTVYKAIKQVGLVLIFILKGPRLIIYCTLDGPCMWTYGAYKYGPEMKCKTGLVLSIALPWLTLFIWIAVFHLFAGVVDDENSEHIALLKGSFIAYAFFLVCANHLRRFYLRPEPKAHLRNRYNPVPVSGQESRIRPIEGNAKCQR